MTIEEHDTIFEEVQEDTGGLAEVNFELLDTEGKWLVKVVSGPNSGAEFFLAPGGGYLIGTDETSCDIVFNDLSVSRQHAKVSVDNENHVFLEDMKSKNGTFLDGEKLLDKKMIASNSLITMGTSTFMLIDRDSERHTIVQPQFLPMKKEEKASGALAKSEAAMGAIEGAVLAPIQSEVEKLKEQDRKEARYAHALSAFVVLALIAAIFIVAAIGTTMLFRTEVIPQQKEEELSAAIDRALRDFPSIRYNYNPSSGKLLLIGHLTSPIDKRKMAEALSQLKFISSVDDNNVVIDEFVWQEMNTLMAKNPSWKGISMTATAPSRYLLSGNLKTKKESDELNIYINQNFPYVDLLEKRVVVEEDLLQQVARKLLEQGFRNIAIGLDNGELKLTGTIAKGTQSSYNQVLDSLKGMAGIRQIITYVSEAGAEQAYQNITDRYQVSGYSARGKTISVVINGKILTKGDSIDGMTITDIQSNTILLEKEGMKYRIDFNR